jgi:hypothetical protein
MRKLIFVEAEANEIVLDYTRFLLPLRFKRDANGIVDGRIIKLCHVRKYSEAFR